ncbi:hypothetical protein BGZ76_008198 [Entomortierella beljakovae]|nr:hypothetical protein BGZ76_008198 [Entomortierella beljakovae]
MIISTPKIDDLSDSNTLTMNNTVANAHITADEWLNEYSKARKHASVSSLTSSNSTATSNTNSLQPRQKHGNESTSAHGYVNRVGFDTISCDDTSEYTFTFQTKTEGWKRTKSTRTFLVGTDLNNYSAHALQYVVENMIEDGDEIKLYQPDILVVGSRGRTGVKGMLSGSVSRYCLNQCLVPVMIVRPERKLHKSKTKAKGIFRRRSSAAEHDYQVHTGQSLQISNSEYDFRNTLTVNGRNPSSRTDLFPSATVHAGDKFSGIANSTQSATSLSSLFTPPPPRNPAPKSSSSTSSVSGSTSASTSTPGISHSASTPTISFPPETRSSMTPPPEGMIKMKKSLTTDGTGKDSKGSSSKGSFFSSFLGKSDKKHKKRNSQG